MTSKPASASRSASDRRPSKTRSAVTNGRRLHVVPPGDTKLARRFKDILIEIISDLGGPDILSEAQRQLARRAATISIQCEQLEAKAVAGKEINLDVYGTLTDRLGRAFGRLGLKRVAKDVTPTLESYIAERYPGDEPEEAAEESEALSANDIAATQTLPSEPPTATERYRPGAAVAS
jgi:hypothetical protein